jgi:hypothetical protein
MEKKLDYQKRLSKSQQWKKGKKSCVIWRTCHAAGPVVAEESGISQPRTWSLCRSVSFSLSQSPCHHMFVTFFIAFTK